MKIVIIVIGVLLGLIIGGVCLAKPLVTSIAIGMTIFMQGLNVLTFGFGMKSKKKDA